MLPRHQAPADGHKKLFQCQEMREVGWWWPYYVKPEAESLWVTEYCLVLVWSRDAEKMIRSSVDSGDQETVQSVWSRDNQYQSRDSTDSWSWSAPAFPSSTGVTGVTGHSPDHSAETMIMLHRFVGFHQDWGTRWRPSHCHHLSVKTNIISTTTMILTLKHSSNTFLHIMSMASVII